jgi:long-chain acyl-CoA synthetase
VTSSGGVLNIIYQRAGMFTGRAAVSTFRHGFWREMSFDEVRVVARELSNYLIAFGIAKGDRIAIVSESSPEFGIVFFAVVRSGGVLVPLDPKQTVQEIVSILNDAQPRILFASKGCYELARAAACQCSSIVEIICTDADGVEPAQNDGGEIRKTLNDVRVIEGGNGCERTQSEPALIVYTSGSTGAPKGVVIAFSSLIFQTEQLEQEFKPGKDDVFLSILPMNHLLEFTAGYLGVLYSGAHVCYLPSLFPEEILGAIREKHVSLMIVVPAFLRLLKNSLQRSVARSKPHEQKLFRLRCARAKLLPRLDRRRLFPEVDRILGRQFRGFISGGAPLGPELSEFFDTIGLDVYQGYGLTETSPVVATNSMQHFRLCSVGKPLPGVEVRILQKEQQEDTGEILTRGPHLMLGYYNRDDLTAEVVDREGWFHTGDQGTFDEDGFLYVTGRIKDLIVLSGGKKVQPEEVEQAIAKVAQVKEVCVLGVQRSDQIAVEEVVAVVVPADGADENLVRDAIISQLEQVASYKRPARFVFTRTELPRTHTKKLRRNAVREWLSAKETATPL